jgi:G3E family GTPase
VADRVLLNKTDLVSPEALRALEGDLRALNGMAAVRRTEFSRVDLDFVLGIDCYGQGRGRGVGGTAAAAAAAFVPPFLLPSSAPANDAADTAATACDHGGSSCTHQGHHHDCEHDGDSGHGHTREVTTLALVEPGLEVDVDKVRRWLGELLWQDEDEDEDEDAGAEDEEGPRPHAAAASFDDGDGDGDGGEKRRGPKEKATEIYRMKGVLAVRGSGLVHILQAVHETFEVEASRSLAWGEGGERARECRVVVIGRGLDGDALRRGLLATVAAEGGRGGGRRGIVDDWGWDLKL